METQFVKDLFLKQMKDVTMKSVADSFDYQFSGTWTKEEVALWN
jgi:hypothetical protein